jgi:hypothetical protein
MANEKMFGCDINEFMDSVDESHTDYLMAAMSRIPRNFFAGIQKLHAKRSTERST